MPEELALPAKLAADCIEEERLEIYRDVVIRDCYHLAEMRPGDLFLDVGACYGIASCEAFARGAYVAALEPSPVFEQLKRYAAVFTCLPYALVGDPSVSHYLRFWHQRPSGAMMALEGEEAFPRTMDLDRAYWSLLYGRLVDVRPALPRVWLKMDIEGGECEILVPSNAEVVRRFDIVTMEYHDDFDAAGALSEMGFEIRFQEGDGHQGTLFAQRKD